MHSKPPSPVIDNPWQGLRRFTAARIALGRTGISLPTNPQLAFQLAHAQARDAVHLPLDVSQLKHALETEGVTTASACLALDSAAADRFVYLQRPDMGRRLSDQSRALLNAARPVNPCDIAFVIADGLSSLAIAQNAAPFLARVMPMIEGENRTVAPLVIVRQGRVAIGDEIGELLGAKLVVVLIGERPGLSSPDSMGLYMTWMPKVGLTDAARNCISNIRPAGLRYEEAAFKLHYLLGEAYKRRLSGVQLKDETPGAANVLHGAQKNFLLEDDAP
jgi:ethanolamine ammonia-lyase small subunit